MNAQVSDNSKACTNCDTTKASKVCWDCPQPEKYYCTGCAEVHVKVKASKGHRIRQLVGNITRSRSGENRTNKSGYVICIHDKERRYCTLGCGGSGICEHMKLRKYCVACKGHAICEHGKNKYHCITCGHNRCEHGRNRYRCLACGTGRCVHKLDSNQCVICKPHLKCIHNR